MVRRNYSPSAGSVLLVEDDPDIGLVLERWLNKNRLQVVRAQSAAEGIELLQDMTFIGSPPHGVLADYRLPDGTGLRIIQEFMSEHPDRPAAMMSAYVDLFLELWARNRRIPIFRKPFDRDDLLTWLDQIQEAKARETMPGERPSHPNRPVIL